MSQRVTARQVLNPRSFASGRWRAVSTQGQRRQTGVEAMVTAAGRGWRHKVYAGWLILGLASCCEGHTGIDPAPR